MAKDNKDKETYNLGVSSPQSFPARQTPASVGFLKRYFPKTGEARFTENLQLL